MCGQGRVGCSLAQGITQYLSVWGTPPETCSSHSHSMHGHAGPGGGRRHRRGLGCSLGAWTRAGLSSGSLPHGHCQACPHEAPLALHMLIPAVSRSGHAGWGVGVCRLPPG